MEKKKEFVFVDFDSKVPITTIPRQKPEDPDCAMKKKNCFCDHSGKLEEPDFSNLKEIMGLSKATQEEQPQVKKLVRKANK